jgi:predicted RNA-binding Zn-ribbon protein involved in translation (DUF1610 family)
LVKKKEEEKLRCPECGALVSLNSLKPVFKKEYVKKDDRLDVPTEMLFGGGWLGKILVGTACPKCGKVIGKPD